MWLGHHLWWNCGTYKWSWSIPTGKIALNFCLTLLAQEHCSQAQMSVLTCNMIKMSIAGLPSWPRNVATYKPCIPPSTWLYRRGMRKVFLWSKAARFWTSASQSVAYWPWASHLFTQSFSFPHLKNEEHRSPPGFVRPAWAHACKAARHKACCRASGWAETCWALKLYARPCAWPLLTYVISLTVPTNTDGYYHLYFTTEKTEDQRSQVPCTKARS